MLMNDTVRAVAAALSEAGVRALLMGGVAVNQYGPDESR
jgi:hypothetical protein